jgi:FdhD protein
MPTTLSLAVAAVEGTGALSKIDTLAVEEALEIRVQQAGGEPRSLTMTMRTPGDDAALAVGFLFAEGVIRGASDVVGVDRLGDRAVLVRLGPGARSAFARAERRFTTTSACGVCGKGSLDDLDVPLPARPLDASLVVPAAVLHQMPAKLRAAQTGFSSTGGVHATALFDAHGALLDVREDVGRHNAMDKLVGAELLAGRVPLSGRVLLVSGRASFELVQKAAMAECPLLAAVGAPSSLAVELAERSGMTLVGFLRDGRFNVYTHRSRIAETKDA